MQKNNENIKKVLLACWLGWLFDGMDSSLYPLVANQAFNELLGRDDPNFGFLASVIVALFLVGWAVGGFLFGFLGDKIGRAKALSYSILTYAICSGLSGLAFSYEQLGFYRFLTGIGIGGEWALGVALLAETVEPKKRINYSAILATGFPIGYFIAVLINHLISPFGWRTVFFFGVIPAILVFFIRKEVDEPEAWKNLEVKAGSPFEIFKLGKKYSYNLLIAFLLGTSCSIGSWAVLLLWFPIWIENSLHAGLEGKTIATFTLMIFHTIGCYLAGYLLTNFKRRTVLVLSYFITFISAFYMYNFLTKFDSSVLILTSILGTSFGIIPASFAIYFPELFPTKVRSTAKGFCYSTGRVFTAIGVLGSGFLVQKFSGDIGKAAAVMSFVFFIGSIISFFAPETNKEVLPE